MTGSLRVDELAEQIAARTPGPGAGTVTGVVATLAASLAAMVARFADRPDLASTAEDTGRRALRLAEADASAYQAYLGENDPATKTALLIAATQIPADLAEIAADIAELVAPLVHDGRPMLRGDARVAAVLALTVVECADVLASANIADDSDPLLATVRDCVRRATIVRDQL